MAYKNTTRISKTRAKFAHILGGKGEDGKVYEFGTSTEHEAHKKRHLFAIKSREDENVAWNFVLGHVIEDLIQEDEYEIEYLGLAANPDKAKFDRFKKKQTYDIAQGRRAKLERMGIYEPPAADLDEDKE